MIMLHFGLVIYLISLWERPKAHHLYDFGISGRVRDSQTNIIESLETPGYFKGSKKLPNNSRKHNMFGNLATSEIIALKNLEKTGADKS